LIDQLIIGSKASYDDFEANVKERKIGSPKKKTIKDTVPFSNLTYDFTGINGEIYWEERTLEYVFEIMAMTPEELEEKKRAFTSWVMNVVNEEIHDPFILDHHFVGTFDDIDPDDSEVEKSTITVTFTAYPYMISNKKKSFTFEAIAGEDITVKIINNSSHRITPTFISDVNVTMKLNNITYSIPAGETTDETFKLPAGISEVILQAVNESGSLTVEFFEEVF